MAANREAVASLLNHPNADIQAAAQAILAEVPEPPPLPTPEFSSRLSASLRSTAGEERKQALQQAFRLHSATPEIRQALAEVMRQDPSPQLRGDARIALARLAPNDPALANASTTDAAGAARDFVARLERNEVPVPELVAAIADRLADPGKVIQQLPKTDDAYWTTSYWQARGFNQAEPTHLPASLVQTLLVGPAHQNRAAYEQMLRAIRQVDPAFQAP